MSFWGDSSSSLPKVGSSKRIISLSRTKPQQPQQQEPNGEKQMSIVNSLGISGSSKEEKVKSEEMPQV